MSIILTDECFIVSTQHHIIQKQVFDIHFTSEQKAFELQNRISGLFYSRLEGVIGGVLDQVTGEHTLVRFDTLEVDVGTVPYDRLEDLLADQLKDALEKALAERLGAGYRPGPAHEDAGVTTVKTSRIELLAHFLSTGTLPWWASRQTITDPLRVLELLLAENPGAIKRLILEVGQFRDVRRRIVYQFPEDVIFAIINVLEPDEAAFIFQYHHEVVNIQRTGQPVKAETTEVAKAVWIFIFTYLLIDRGSNFNRKVFVKSTLGQMAEHYNLRYEDLLKLFAVPLLNPGSAKARNHSLGGIIHTLFMEQEPDTRTENDRDMAGGARVEDDPANIQRQARLIGYYLRFGSLPSWADHYDEKQLSAIFSGLIHRAPEVTRQLIGELDNKRGAIRNIAYGFDDVVITGIIGVVEPAHAAFIVSYMDSVQHAQREKPVVKADNRAFTRSVWQFVLTYLFIDRGSVFNTRMFLESNVRQMAQAYNLHFEHLLMLLTESIREQPDAVRLPLFHLLADILRFHEDAGKDITRARPSVPDELLDVTEQKNDLAALPGSRTLFDILRFWISHGFFPWWGENLKMRSPEEMWRLVMSRRPDGILRLLKYAGIEPVSRRRLVYQLSHATLMATFSLLPGGTDAVGYYESMVWLLEDFSVLKIKHPPAWRQPVLLAWWETIIFSGYQAFDLPRFAALSIGRLSRWTGLYEGSIRDALARIGRLHVERGGHEKFKAVLSLLVKELQKPSKIAVDPVEEEPNPDIRMVIGQYLLADEHAGEQDILRASLATLSYFLTWNKLPDKMPGLSPSLLDSFLKRLLQLLIREKPVALRAILQQETHLSHARMRIHDVFATSAGSTDNAMKNLLREFLPKDLFRYIVETSGRKSDMNRKGLQEMLEDMLHLSAHPLTGHDEEFLRALLRSSAFTGYMAENYEGNILKRLVERMMGSGGKMTVLFLAQVRDLLNLAARDTLEKQKVDRVFFQFSLHYLAGESRVKTPLRYFARLLPRLEDSGQPEEASFYENLLHVTVGLTPTEAIPAGLIAAIGQQLQTLIKGQNRRAVYRRDVDEPEPPPAKDRSVKQEIKKQSPGILPQQNKHDQHKLAVITTEEESGAKKSWKVKDDTIYIGNSGLVLLHPFLSTYFSRLALTEKGKFTGDTAAFRAVHLLQFLADGKGKHAEHTLVLNKLLCGLPIEEAVPAEITLTEAESALSMELLKMVIGRWDKLKNTSIEGLRVSFLQREGKLKFEEDSWKLRVDQRGYDVLLQTLPWGIGLIKTSWMDKILHVEWI